ncbi:pentapeptide repeat-containing protein [Pseudomonas entomophila]|nr:pentapeptide repeat-containing protein [Pseudomonas entomophila]WMW08118.1 pentapeptide repeat-containing protein [Pseudomonas entomophila]
MSETQEHTDIRTRLAGIEEHIREQLVMFFQCEEHGTPERISKAGCMALAKLGATVWNAWRDKFPAERYGHFDHVNIADFSSVDFNGKQWDFGGEICFDGFKFGAGADFKNAIFPRHTSFERAVFGESSDFSNAAVDARSSFKHAKFSRYTKLVSIQLDDWIDFDYAEFEGNNDFSGSSFGHSVRFNGVKFGSDINFSDCFFADGVCFETIQDPTVDAVDWIPYGSTSKTFNKISFERSVFKGFVSFKNREFRDTTIFDGVTFNQPPDFFGCALHQDMSFKAVVFPPATGKDFYIRTYRNLRLSFSQLQAPQEEHMFFQLEMAEIAHGQKGARRCLFYFYEKLSRYGSSLSRPLFAYLASFILFSCIYAVLSWATHCLPTTQRCSFNMAGVEFAVLQAIPLPGLEKMAEPLRLALIASDGFISLAATIVIVLQKSISLLLIFLVGLALRNIFRIK